MLIKRFYCKLQCIDRLGLGLKLDKEQRKYISRLGFELNGGKSLRNDTLGVPINLHLIVDGELWLMGSCHRCTGELFLESCGRYLVTARLIEVEGTVHRPYRRFTGWRASSTSPWLCKLSSLCRP